MNRTYFLALVFYCTSLPFSAASCFPTFKKSLLDLPKSGSRNSQGECKKHDEIWNVGEGEEERKTEHSSLLCNNKGNAETSPKKPFSAVENNFLGNWTTDSLKVLEKISVLELGRLIPVTDLKKDQWFGLESGSFMSSFQCTETITVDWIKLHPLHNLTFASRILQNTSM